MESVIGLGERSRYVRAASAIGLAVGLLFSVYNMLTPGLMALGLTELSAVLLLVAPAAVLSHQPSREVVAETLLLLSAAVIFGALIVTGGEQGTGLFWVYTVPFLAFFLKGERGGWAFSLAFLGVVAVYLLGISPGLPGVYHFSIGVSIHFLLSLAFYVLVAAAFNHARSLYEVQLKEGKAQAEAAYVAKSRFLAAASHDLRQPAHALGMFVARLAQLPHDESTRELVAGVEASVRALQEMLDAFFDYSRLDAPALQLRRQAFPINQLFDQLHSNFAAIAEAKGLRLCIRKSPQWLESDPVLLHRVLLNLVSNALQYTQEGTVLVACRPATADAQARIEVWDSGVGIAPEHHDKVFDEFFQVSNPERDRSKGLGLGLSMVTRACQFLGHPLQMRSALGCGTRFTLWVPTTPAQTVATPDETDQATGTLCDGAGLDPLKVWLIEDDLLGCTALTGLLKSWGCQVAVADSAMGAMDLVRQGMCPDFVVSDYRLRGEHDGIEAVHMVREALGTEVAACLISGDTDADLRQQVQQAGLVLLQKPVRPAKLRSVLRHAVRNV